MSRQARLGGQRGQATVEAVALLPLLVVAGMAVLQVLAAGASAALAGHAAEAGAVAILQGRDPRAAARAAVPGWSRGGMEVRVTGGRHVRIRLRPRGPVRALAERLTASAEADAGAAPR